MNGEPPGTGVPPTPDDPTAAPPAENAASTHRNVPGTAPEAAVTITQRTVVALLAALFLFGSCGIAYGVFRLATTGDGDTAPSAPIPAPSTTASPSPSPTVSPSPSPTGRAMPDLLVAELTGRSVTVRNIGSAAAGRFVVSVAGRAIIVEDGLAPGADATFAFGCRAGPLTASVDSTERISELLEDNNTRTAGPFDCVSPTVSPSVSPTISVSPSQPPELPDLVVRSISFDRVVVANDGEVAAGPFVVNAGTAGSFNVGGLGAKRSTTLRFPCTSGAIVVEVDPSDQVPESNEGNNRRAGGPFQCLADLVVSNLGPDSVTVANVGIGPAGPSILVIQGFAIPVGGLEPGGQATFTYPCIGGDVTATADAQGQVDESNEGNNQADENVGPCP